MYISEQDKGRALWVRPLSCTSVGLYRSSAADEVHDDRDQGKDEKQVNQKAADVKDEESA
jgi:hypothetical protein